MEWLRRTLFHTDLASDARILERDCHQILKAVTACQSNDLSLCTQFVQSQIFDNDKCNHCASRILVQNSFIRQVLRRLEPSLSDNNMTSSVPSVSSSSSDLSSSEGDDEMNVFYDMKCVQEGLSPNDGRRIVKNVTTMKSDPIECEVRLEGSVAERHHSIGCVEKTCLGPYYWFCDRSRAVRTMPIEGLSSGTDYTAEKFGVLPIHP